MRVCESLDGLVNVLAVINSDSPFLEGLYRVLRGTAHCGIWVRLFDDRCLVRRNSGLIREVVERDDGALKRDFAQILGANLVQCLVRFRDRILHGSFDRFRRLLPIGNR